MFLVRCDFFLDWIGQAYGRSDPFVASFLDFPWLRFAALQANICARISRPSKPDLVPGPGMRVIHFDAILKHQFPVAMDRHPLPYFFRARHGLRVVDRLE